MIDEEMPILGMLQEAKRNYLNARDSHLFLWGINEH